MILLELFLGFLKVGLFSFGAYSAIPLIREVVLSNGWMTDETLSNIIAISESTPGPIMVNAATYVGSTQAGFTGALVATVAVVLPAFVIFVLISTVMQHFVENRYVKAVLGGMRSCVIGIIAATGIIMLMESFGITPAAVKPDISAMIIAAILVAVFIGGKKIFHKNISPIMLIGIGALLGIIFYL